MARGQYIDPRAARITFQQYAERWVATQGADPNTQASMESQLRLHAFPHLGTRPLGSFQPAHIRDWVRQLQENGVRGSYARTIYSNVRAALRAAVDDGHLPRNPCAARSVRPPTVDAKRVIPWASERLFAVRAAAGALSGHGRPGRRLRAPSGRDPGRGRRRDRLRVGHAPRGPATEAEPQQGRVTGPRGGHVWRTSLNEEAWKPALAAAGVILVPGRGQPYAESRENGMHALCHFYASVLLDAGENIKALAEYLGHSDPGLTLRV